MLVYISIIYWLHRHDTHLLVIYPPTDCWFRQVSHPSVGTTLPPVVEPMGVSAKTQSWRILIGEWWIHQSFRGILQVYRYTPIFRLLTRYFMVKSMDSDRLFRKLGWFYVIFPSFSETVVRSEYQVDFRETLQKTMVIMVLLSCERSHSRSPRLVWISGISPRSASGGGGLMTPGPNTLAGLAPRRPRFSGRPWDPKWPKSFWWNKPSSRHSVLLSVGFTELRISTLDGFSQTDLGYGSSGAVFEGYLSTWHGHSGNVWSRGHWTKGHWPLVRASVAEVAE